MSKITKPEKIALYIVGGIILVWLIGYGITNFDFSSINKNSENLNKNDLNPVIEKKCRQEQVPYQEREPYETIECNQVPLKYNKKITSCRDSILYVGNAKVACEVTNSDSEYGLFDVTVNLNCGDGQWFKATQKMSLDPYSSDTFSYADISFCEDVTCSCDVEPSTKQVCENVVKYRTVTKYKTEEVCD